jgi:hypothetical protein
MGGYPFSGDGSFRDTRDGRGVVQPSGDGGILDVVVGGDEVELSQGGGMFQIAVGDGSAGVGFTNKALLYG